MVKLNIYEKYAFYKNKGLSGLSNLGNTCYMNSILQCLSNTLPLSHYLLTMKIESPLNNLIQMYIKVLLEIWKENSPLAPVSFKKCLNIILPKYKNNIQHDAHEFLLDFMNILHDNLSIKEVDFDININASKYIKEANSSLKTHIKKKSIISELFNGQIIKKFTCNDCNYTFRRYEPFLSLDLYCPKPERELSHHIKNNFQRDYQYFSCENCGNENRHVEHEVDSGIFKFPEVLIILLKRFTTKSIKNINSVILNDTLDFSEYSYISTDESVIYDIKSIVCHTGKSLDYGHYFTLIKNDFASNGVNWTCFNDTSVNDFDITNLDPSYPYILFYQRRH